LFHYTGVSGFCDIVQSGKLRATHLAYMNDSSEYQHAITLLRDAAAHERKNNRDARACALLACMLPQIATLPPWDLPPIFVACFSAASDSLSQWRSYGGGEGGIALGFDRAGLQQAIPRKNSWLSPVVYDEAKKRDLVRALVEWSVAEFRKFRS